MVDLHMIGRDRFASLTNNPWNLEISKAVYPTDDSTGGDRVDTLEGPDGHVHLIILDACGHGAQAVRLADMALYTVRTLLWQGLTPATVFASLNRLLLDLYKGHGETSFGSGAIVSLDLDRSTATFASAGHVDALRFSHDGRKHHHHSSTGPLFGVEDNARYHDEIFPYLLGESFVLMTDGLLDVSPIDKSTEFLGTAGVCRVIREVLSSPGGISAGRVISTARRIAGGVFDDDVAVMIVAIR